MARRRVVITGMGLATSVGVGKTHVWRRVLNGESGITIVGKGDPRYKAIPPLIGGAVPRGVGPGMLDEETAASKSETQKYPSVVTLGLAVSEMALNDAGYSKNVLEKLPESQKDRMGICSGASLSDFHDIAGFANTMKTEGFHKADSYILSRLMHDSLATAVSVRYGLQGPKTTAMTGCAAGTSIVGDSFRIIRDGHADLMLAGGAYPFLTPVWVAGLFRANALCTLFEHAPEKASRPFDRDRAGLAPSEGAGMVVLEEFEKAKARGARMYGEILGYGMSGDAYHVLTPRPDGRGAYNAMAAALTDAQQIPENVSYINAHATSTQLGDAAENRALVRLFGKTNRLAVSSTKGTTGHMLMAAGVCETAFTALALKTRELPPTINLDNLDPPGDYPFNYVPNEAQQLRCDGQPVGLNNSFGMGGVNACLCMRAM